MSRQVQLDLQTLGYSHAALCECLAALKPGDYRGRRDYGDGLEYDVYHPHFAGPSGFIDELYVKLCFRTNPVEQIFLRSFHLQRY